MTDEAQEMRMTIPSDFKFLGAVDAAIQDLAREFSFAKNSMDDVSTALIEACSNAIEHGNKFDKDKRVKVVLLFNGDAFTAKIYDQGPGFDYKALQDETAPLDPMSERGRGIMIMQAFTDGLKFSYDEGLCVELRKLVKDGEDEEPADAE